MSSLGGAGSTSPSQSAIGQLVWGFHAMRGGIDPEDHFLRPRFFGAVHVSKLSGLCPPRVPLAP